MEIGIKNFNNKNNNLVALSFKTETNPVIAFLGVPERKHVVNDTDNKFIFSLRWTTYKSPEKTSDVSVMPVWQGASAVYLFWLMCSKATTMDRPGNIVQPEHQPPFYKYLLIHHIINLWVGYCSLGYYEGIISGQFPNQEYQPYLFN